NNYRTTLPETKLKYRALQRSPISPIISILYFSPSLKLNNLNTCFRYVNNISIIVIGANTKKTT
ncbi:hypothetical protein M431DRAFT_102123, partial [Trichoderma harzianum CBS 226.95]